jgi:phenylpropionate dioxygenase-like ring-hydroxylating dioxygenase large terminal subunit
MKIFLFINIINIIASLKKNIKVNKKNEFIKEINNNHLLSYSTLPRLDDINKNGELTWYPIGFSKDFNSIPKRVTLRDINYIVWKNKKNNYYALRDCCTHQGSSFMNGKTIDNKIICPYHGYTFDGNNGDLLDIPHLHFMKSNSHNIHSFKIVEKGDVVYFNNIPITNEEKYNNLNENKIFIEPEYYDNNQRVIYITENFENYGKIVTMNSLDICHIGFVHSFGNNKNPNPTNHSNIIKIFDNDYHYKIIYDYISGKNSIVNKVYNFNNISVENEYILPHSTVARVKFGNYSSTIITHALPISKFKTKLFVKAYRNYWTYDTNKCNILFYPIFYLFNIIGDMITKNTMHNTVNEDKLIVDNIDKSSYENLHGKFSIYYDMFSNHYRNNYKKFYEDEDFINF